MMSPSDPNDEPPPPKLLQVMLVIALLIVIIAAVSSWTFGLSGAGREPGPDAGCGACP